MARISIVISARSSIARWRPWIAHFLNFELPHDPQPWSVEFLMERITPADIDTLVTLQNSCDANFQFLLDQTLHANILPTLVDANIPHLPGTILDSFPLRQVTLGVGTVIEVANMWSLTHQIRLVAKQREVANHPPSPVIALDRLPKRYANIVRGVNDGFPVQDRDDDDNVLAWKNFTLQRGAPDYLSIGPLLTAYAETYRAND
jgi:hypothetical protein